MNLLLLRPDEVLGDEATVDDRRATHVLGLLRKGRGDTLRVGVLGEGVCQGSIAEVDAQAARVRLTLQARTTLPAPRTSLILALPRPKAVSRIVQLAASFGVRHMTLVGARKVDPAYFSSPRLHPARLAEDAWLGLEQGGLVHMPTFEVQRSLRSVVRETPAAELPGQARVLFDPSAATDLAGVLLPLLTTAQQAWVESPGDALETTLAFGPDGGFLPEELELFEQAGFRAARLASSTLRTEVAVAAGLGQLELLEQLAFRQKAPRVVLSPCPD